MACPREFDTKIETILGDFSGTQMGSFDIISCDKKNLILVLLEECLEVPCNQAYCRTVFRCDGFSGWE
jgi:hypothetical protein